MPPLQYLEVFARASSFCVSMLLLLFAFVMANEGLRHDAEPCVRAVVEVTYFFCVLTDVTIPEALKWIYVCGPDCQYV